MPNQSPSDDERRPERRPNRRPRGLIETVLAVFIALLVLVYFRSDGSPSRIDWVLIYTCIALVTGISFWILTPKPSANSELSLTALGIKLGGAAAVGASFMLITNQLAHEPPPYVIVELPEQLHDHYWWFTKKDDHLEFQKLSASRYLFEFAGDHHDGALEISTFENMNFTLMVNRSGRMDLLAQNEGSSHE